MKGFNIFAAVCLRPLRVTGTLTKQRPRQMLKSIKQYRPIKDNDKHFNLLVLGH